MGRIKVGALHLFIYRGEPRRVADPCGGLGEG